MLNIGRLCVVVTVASLLTIPAFAQERHPRILQQADDKKMVKQPMSDIDKRMVRNCKAMPYTKMRSDPECQLYLKNHPDWMRGQ